MREAPDGLYVFQPYGWSDEGAKTSKGRLWGVGGGEYGMTIRGLTKEEAELVKEVLEKKVDVFHYREMAHDLVGQLGRLSRFILEEVEGEPSLSEGAIDTSIRLLREWQPKSV